MLEKLKEEVFAANLRLKDEHLVTLTWGNVSGIDRDSGLVVIKPSGVPYDRMTAADMVVTDLAGNVAEGSLRPSSDLPTHLVLYKAFPRIGGVTHTHSRFATVFAQAGRDIPALGTTHADAFYGDVPCTRPLTPAEIAGDYEAETGNVIVETVGEADPARVPAALVYSHGPFTWGANAAKSVDVAVTLEEVAFMAYHTLTLAPEQVLQKELADRHFDRKHGEGAYYGQVK